MQRCALGQRRVNPVSWGTAEFDGVTWVISLDMPSVMATI